MGLGKAVAIDLAKAGAIVIINDPVGDGPAESVLKMIKKIGKKAFLVTCDISDAPAVSTMINTILKRFIKVDILINNAGISIDALTINYNIDAWERVIKVNLSGAFLCSKYCLSSMIDQKWGRIINISSVAGLTGISGTPAYSASKAGLIGLTKTLAKEVGRKGITVNCLALGYIEGGGLFDTVREELLEETLAQIPIGRWGQLEDVTSVIKFLLSEDASYITGQTIGVNGGLHM